MLEKLTSKTMKQLQHTNTPLQRHSLVITLACHFIDSPANLGMICRNAEAFGVHQIWLSPSQSTLLKSSRFLRTARSSQQQIEFKEVSSLEEKLQEYAISNTKITALEWTKNSLPLQQMEKTSNSLLILGNENTGIPEEILSICHQIIHINQFGKNSSINVAQALGICLYELTR